MPGLVAAAGRVLEGARTFSDRQRGAPLYGTRTANGLAEIAVNQGRADRELGLDSRYAGGDRRPDRGAIRPRRKPDASEEKSGRRPPKPQQAGGGGRPGTNGLPSRPAGFSASTTQTNIGSGEWRSGWRRNAAAYAPRSSEVQSGPIFPHNMTARTAATARPNTLTHGITVPPTVTSHPKTATQDVHDGDQRKYGNSNGRKRFHVPPASGIGRSAFAGSPIGCLLSLDHGCGGKDATRSAARRRRLGVGGDTLQGFRPVRRRRLHLGAEPLVAALKTALSSSTTCPPMKRRKVSSKPRGAASLRGGDPFRHRVEHDPAPSRRVAALADLSKSPASETVGHGRRRPRQAIGGYYSFQGIDGRARWRKTPIEDVLPVTCLAYDDRIEMPGATRCSRTPAIRS